VGKRFLALCGASAALALFAACGSSGAGGREIDITQRDDGCTPTAVSVSPGEKLNFVVKNDSSKDSEIEGVEGTSLEELEIPEGKTRSAGYDVPKGAGTHKVKCYQPDGVSTIIELSAS
jgi:plastocyanin